MLAEYAICYLVVFDHDYAGPEESGSPPVAEGICNMLAEYAKRWQNIRYAGMMI